MNGGTATRLRPKATADPRENCTIVEVRLIRVLPTERIRRRVRSLEAQDEKLIEERSSKRTQTSFRFIRFLVRVSVFAHARGRVRPVAFERHVAPRTIDADYADGDGRAVVRFELVDLPFQIVYDAINLAKHRLLNNLHFDADFNRGDGPTLHNVTGISNRCDVRDYLSKAAVAAACFDAVASVLDVEDRERLVDSCYILLRSFEIVQVFVKLNRYVITLT